MRLLLDTHVLLWWLAGADRLGEAARDQVAASESAFVNSATAWELAIKAGLGKVDMPADLQAQLRRHRFTVLPIHFEHAVRAGALPPLHRDPFDRMLVAQAQVEDLAIVSADLNIRRYDVPVTDARV